MKKELEDRTFGELLDAHFIPVSIAPKRMLKIKGNYCEVWKQTAELFYSKVYSGELSGLGEQLKDEGRVVERYRR